MPFSLENLADPSRLAAAAPLVTECCDGDSYFDGLAWLAQRLLLTPFAQVTVVDQYTSWWVGCAGIDDSRSDPVEHSFCQHVIAASGPLLINDARVHPLTRSNPWIANGVVAWAGHPIKNAADQILGTVCVIDTVVRAWTEEDAQTLAVLALAAGADMNRRAVARAGLETESAFVSAVKVGRTIELRAVRLAELTRRLSACDAVEEVTAAIIDLGPDLLDAPLVSTAILDTERRCLVMHHGTLTPRDLSKKYGTISLDSSTPHGDALRTRLSVVLAGSDEMSALYPDLAVDARQVGLETLVFIPLFAPDGWAIGTLSIGWREHVQLSAAAWAFIDTTAELCAQAMVRCRLADARRDLVLSMQLELLPTMPTINGLDLAVHYAPARHEIGFGGDWYDAIELDPDSTAIVVGDVCGHGVRAAARMTEIRSTVGALIRLYPDDLGMVLVRAGEMFKHFDDPYLATVAIWVLNSATSSISYISAGHPPAVLVQPDGSWTALEGGRGTVLGQAIESGFAPAAASWPVGAVLAAFTDGLVERRDRRLDDGIAHLADIVGSGCSAAAVEISRDVVAALGHHDYDDAVLVIARRSPS